MNILDYHYGNKTIDEIKEKYLEYFAISELTVSTPFLYSRFKKINHRKPFSKKIKPFNFCLVGFGNESVKPIAPYRKNPSEAVYDDFIDYNTGEIHCGEQFWKNLKQIFWEYLNHPESKFDGNKGELQRKHIKAGKVTVIGKESSNLEESEILGLDDNSYQIFENLSLDKKKILSTRLKDALAVGISKNQLYRIKKKIRNNNFRPSRKTIQKLLKLLENF